jgi:hypothetical protein
VTPPTEEPIELSLLLDELYRGTERLPRDEIYRRATADDLPADLLVRLNRLPEGDYALDELLEALDLLDAETVHDAD